jgi:hypothetical protein
VTDPIVIAPVVEGHGEVAALPVLLRRVGELIAPDSWIDVHPPIRVNRGTLLKAGQLERYVELAARSSERAAVLVLLDADDDCPAELGPDLLRRARAQRPERQIAVVIAMREFEAWFLAAAESVAGQRGLSPDLKPPPDPEAIRDAKGWLQDRRTDGLAYGPTIDQPALTATFDLELARTRSASLDKLWREVERLARMSS